MSATTTTHSWFVYVVRFRDLATRAHVMKSLGERGIPSRPYFPPIHLQPFYRADFGFRPGAFPITEAAGDTCLALPFYGAMPESMVSTVTTPLARS
jgi:dTDP-4-amino-4,6-dideoxygalactose transaminase